MTIRVRRTTPSRLTGTGARSARSVHRLATLPAAQRHYLPRQSLCGPPGALRLRKPLALIDSWEFSHASMADDPHPPRIFVTDKEADPVVCAVAAVDWVFNQLGE